MPADTSFNLGNISKDLYCSCVDHLSSHMVLELVGCFIVDLYVTERGNMEKRGIVGKIRSPVVDCQTIWELDR